MPDTTKQFLCGLLLLALNVNAEDEMRDFYAEPGLNPFHSAAGQDGTEHIDPFSGNLQLSYVDLNIPGNGGLDINITRYYNLPQGSPGYANPFGYGWTMHFGRITIGSGHARQLCNSAAVPGGDTNDNPSIEMPSGGRELLVRSSALNDGSYISRSNWKAQCIDSEDYSKGLVATSPDGVSYYMREYIFMQGEDGPAGEPAPTVETWLTNRITDAHGNSIDITYLSVASGMKLAVRIDTSDGRQVVLDYVDSSGAAVSASSVNARLSRIGANGHSWRYEYAPVDAVANSWGFVDHYLLRAVVRPDGTRWEYDYGGVASEPGFRRLAKVRYPTGGEIHYSYQRVWPYLPQQDFFITAIEAKTQVNPGHDGGTWIYEFFPGAVDMADLGVQPAADNSGRMADFTRITTPVGQEHIYHVGYWALVDTHNLLWQMSLKLKHQHLVVDPSNGSLSVVRSVSNAWSSREISDEVYRGGILSALWDEKTYASILTRQSVRLDGYVYTTDYESHDVFGFPRVSTQSSSYPSENGNRITQYNYRNDIAGWFLGLPESESVTQDGVANGVISRSYGDTGLLLSENHFGVPIVYDYTNEGDLLSATDARGHTTTYSDYYRGVAQLEMRPDGSRLSRVVHPQGVVVARTSATGHTTAFTYDGLNRLVGIEFPVGADVSVSWNNSGKVLTRGDYRESVQWDGFGREVRLARSDLSSGVSYVVNYRYDLLGRRVFTSNVNSAQGILQDYDVIGRLQREVNQDGSDRTITYEGAHRELHRDESGNVVEYLHQVYGSPSLRFLSWVIAPEGVATRIARDAYGNILSVFQGGLDPENTQQYLGYFQHYAYNAKLQLTSIESAADIGLTNYGRDAIGNMVSRQVGGGATVVYDYDPMNRLANVDYNDDSIDVAYAYDADGNVLSVGNSFGDRSYRYDANGNLLGEDLRIDQAGYSLNYSYNQLDYLESIAYPSGRVIDYVPDALGKPTRAAPYLTDVIYHPDGSVQHMNFANGRTMSFSRTARNQVATINISGLLGLVYDYDQAGNVAAIADALAAGENRYMSYDSLHRLTSSTGSWGVADYGYDVFGNLTRKSDPARANRDQYHQYVGLMLDRVAYSDNGAQRVFSYDDYGNINFSDDVVFDVITGAPLEVHTRRQHSFDDAGNMRFSSRAGRSTAGAVDPLRSGSFSSEYDGDNNRIRKINHSADNAITHYVYSASGLLMGEYDLAGTYYGNEYFYVDKQQVATAKHNAPPQLDAVADIQIAVGATVDLAATAYDLDGEVAGYAWVQLSGPEVAIDDPHAQTTFFLAPQVEAGSSIVIEYSAIDDRGAVSSQLLTVTILENQAPVADAGLDSYAMAGSPVFLDGSASSDAEDVLSYSWSGPYLSESDSATPLVLAAEEGYDYALHYTLTVTDSEGLQDSDEVSISVLTLSTDDDGDRLPDGWELYHFGDIASHNGGGDPDGDGVDNLTEYADGSIPTTADTAAAVSGLAVVAGSTSNLLVWERPVAAQGFDVYWTTELSLPLSAWNRHRLTGRHFAHTGLSNGVIYYYVVQSFNNQGSAEASAPVSSTPGSPAWRAPLPGPDLSPGVDRDSSRVSSNRLGDSVLIAEVFENSEYHLYAWQYSALDGWGERETISQNLDPHEFAMPAIDGNGNVLVVWATGASGERSLYSRYRGRGDSFKAQRLVESYQGDELADGDVVDLSHLDFSADGRAYACWRQNRGQLVGAYGNPSAASAIISRFDPITGWAAERNLEAANNAGDTRSLSCGVSPGGRVTAAWGRYNTFDTGDNDDLAWDYDVWVSAYDPVRGWIEAETVEFLHAGVRESGGAGEHNLLPQVSQSADKGLVVWHNSSGPAIDSLIFNFTEFNWAPQETLESKSRRIPENGGHKVAGNEAGMFFVSWGDHYVTQSMEDITWGRSATLPAVPEIIGVDEQDQLFMAYRSGASVMASRRIDTSWSSAAVNRVNDLEAKRLTSGSSNMIGNLAVHWMSASALYLSTDEFGDPPPLAGAPPVTTLALSTGKFKGARRYTIELVSNKPGTTHFRFVGDGVLVSGGDSSAAWQMYSAPVTIQMDKGGAGEFEFYSQDDEGKQEIIKTEIL